MCFEVILGHAPRILTATVDSVSILSPLFVSELSKTSTVTNSTRFVWINKQDLGTGFNTVALSCPYLLRDFFFLDTNLLISQRRSTSPSHVSTQHLVCTSPASLLFSVTTPPWPPYPHPQAAKATDHSSKSAPLSY